MQVTVLSLSCTHSQYGHQSGSCGDPPFTSE
jgi:hypothetical protein